jgi:hypothetical protein
MKMAEPAARRTQMLENRLSDMRRLPRRTTGNVSAIKRKNEEIDKWNNAQVEKTNRIVVKELLLPIQEMLRNGTSNIDTSIISLIEYGKRIDK